MKHLRSLFAHGKHRIDCSSTASIEAALNLAEVNAYLRSIANGE